MRNPPAVEADLGLAERILVLGPSSTFGWGVREEDTYSRRLERVLSAAGRRVCVVNAGEIGFSSWQGSRLYQSELRALRPSVIVLAYGVNDMDRYRFFFNDFQPDSVSLPSASQGKMALREALDSSAAWRVAEKVAAGLRLRFLDCGGVWGAEGAPPLRVSVQDYVRFERRMAKRARRDRAVVILVTSIYRPRSSTKDPGAAARWYEASARYRHEGRCRDARRAFDAARRAEPRRLAEDVQRYNATLRKLSKNLKLPLLDLDKLFVGRNPDRLLVDPVHFSVEGHLLIARALARMIESEKAP